MYNKLKKKQHFIPKF